MTRVLVYIPTIGNMMQPETIASVRAQNAPGVDVDITVGRHNPHGSNKPANLLAQQTRARNMTLDGGYDALVLVEHDMLIPEHAIKTMVDTPEQVVYATYLFRHRQYMLNAFQYINNRNLGMSLMQHPDELEEARAAGVWRVSGAGFGCTMIRRQTLEDIPFRMDPDYGDKYADLPFAKDCLHAGIVSVARMDVQCLHWCPETETWLSIEEHTLGETIDVIAKQNVVVAPQGVQHRMVAGKTYHLPLDDAIEYQRAGFVEIVESKPAAEEKPKRRRRKGTTTEDQ